MPHADRRSPCGERGLKCIAHDNLLLVLASRSPCGERGLKWRKSTTLSSAGRSRSPCGERGLKSFWKQLLLPTTESLPVRGAWIEISVFYLILRCVQVAPRAGSED